VIVTNPFRPGTWTRAEIDGVSKGWGVLLVSGILSLVAGGIIVLTDWSINNLAAFIGALLVLRGTFTLLSVPVDGSRRIWSIGYGLIELGVGIAVWVWPGPTLLVIAAFIGWLLLFRGTMAIAGSVSGRQFIPYWGLILAVGIAEVAAGFYLLSRPGLTLVVAVLVIGFMSMAYGVVQIVVAFEVKNLPSRSDELAKQFDDIAGTGRSDTPRAVPAQQRDR
jgi:uncharacterized membrane protein HdeD (DUF308 family)